MHRASRALLAPHSQGLGRKLAARGAPVDRHRKQGLMLQLCSMSPALL